MDVNLPRDKDTGKTKGFGFLMYEDQRSTILAVDNLNGARVLEKTLRVDHVKNYKQPKVKNEDGEWVDPEEQSFNAKPQLIEGKSLKILLLYCLISLFTFLDDAAAESDSSAATGASIDPEDPMRDYLIEQRRKAKALEKTKKSKGKHKDETPEERRARKAKKKERKERKARKAGKVKSEGLKGVEDLLKSLGRR